jgi:hypothetical protein
MKFEDVVYDWDLRTIETFVVKVLEAHAELFDGCPPEDFPNPLEHDGYGSSISTACRVIANSIAGTKMCPEGIGIGDLVGLVSDDVLAATKAVAANDFGRSEAWCRNAAQKFITTYCTGEDA